MKLLFWTQSGWQEYVEWQQDRKTLKRINRLLQDIFLIRSAFLPSPNNKTP